MRRYFDADKLKEFVDKQYKYCHGYTGTKKDVYREALLAVKSAIHCQSVSKDMQEVVRCKDCEYFVDEQRKNRQGICVCGIKDTSYASEFYPYADDFCSYGERKDEV